VSEYQHLIEKSIISDYRKAPADTVARIDEQTIPIVNGLKLEGGVEKFDKSGAFVLLKDHKPNFSTNLPCRLVNPAKSDIGKISKILLDQH
jgi:sRNA-binding regulator protein Hfq